MANRTQLDKLKTLENILENAIQNCTDSKSLAQLSRQYRETLKEIAEIEGMTVDDDEIGELLTARKANGKSDSVR